MKNKTLIFIIIILSLIAIISSFKKETTYFYEEEKQPNDIIVRDNQTKEEQKLNLEDYVIGVVAGEMPASFMPEALKAQAIAARTYAIYKMNTTSKDYDVTTDVSNQVYITTEKMKDNWQNNYEKYYNKIKNAVMDTKDMVMKYNGEVISSYYFAISNGKTEDVALVFGQNIDYLKSVDSSWDRDIKNFVVTKELSKKEFCQNLNISCEKIEITDVTKSDSGRISFLKVNGVSFKGTEIRKLLSLRSTDFEIFIGDKISITTKGYGHGVGMSQYGANEMAKNGYNYEDILKHYYKDVQIEKLSV